MVYYYRYEAMNWESGVHVYLQKLPVVKETPCGVWVEQYGGGTRFVLKAARKRFACPTQEEALTSFKARKRRQIGILRAQLERAEEALDKAENFDVQ